MGPLKSVPEGVSIAVWAIPGSKKPGIDGIHGERLKVRVAVPAEAGAANREVARLLSASLGVDVDHTHGMSSRAKMFVARGIDVDDARRLLGI